MLRKISALILLAFIALPAISQTVPERLAAIKYEDFPNANVVVVFDSTIADVQETGLTYVNSLFAHLEEIVSSGFPPRSVFPN